MRGNLLLPPPWAGDDPAVAPDRIEPHLLVRGIQPARVDIGPIAWEEINGISGRTPSEQEVDDKRRWLYDSLVWPEAACFVPLNPDSLDETIRVAAFLGNIVGRVIAVVNDVSTLAHLDTQNLDRLSKLEALLVSDDYIPLKHRRPIPGVPGTSSPTCRNEAMLHVRGLEDGWVEIERLLSEHNTPGCRWSVAAPPALPPSDHIFRLLVEAGCEELRVRVRSFSPKLRTRLGEPYGVEEIVATLREARQHGIKTAVLLEVGFPGESHDVFLNSLRVLHAISHLIDSVYDLKTHWRSGTSGLPHDWHDGCANNLSWRQKKCRELAAFLVGEGIPCPWFFLPGREHMTDSFKAIHQRLLNCL